MKILNTFVFILVSFLSQAQYTKPSWMVGLGAGANFNFYRGTTQELNSSLTVPQAFNKGNGLGLFLAPMVEYKRDSMWGAMLQIGYDNRSGSFNHVYSPCNCREDLSAKLSYLTVEPSLRYAPFKSKFYIFGGPRLAFNLSKSFAYQGTSSPNQPLEKGNFDHVRGALISPQIGAGYDMPLSGNTRNQYVLSPFISFQPYFGQFPRAVETWSVSTIRLGANLKVGRGNLILKEPPVVIPDPEVSFAVVVPENIQLVSRVREIFPLRNYIFFDIGSSKIPSRYILLNKKEVKGFKESQLDVLTPKELSGRSDRQMIAYYNILNILGDRMNSNPKASINLVGSAREGDGLAMADSIKSYLVDVFSISASRISTQGVIKSKIPSEQPGGKHELILLREEDRRVSVESSFPDMLMEFQSGPSAPLKPVELLVPVEKFVSFTTKGVEYWTLNINDGKDDKVLGMFHHENVLISEKSILGLSQGGHYKFTMSGKSPSGKNNIAYSYNVISPESIPVFEEGLRFSIIFEFNTSVEISMYNKYLTEVVVPKIPKGANVIINGYTDVIGEEASNQLLSEARTKSVLDILERNTEPDVTFESHSYGEKSPFNNDTPEGRSYNRMVTIDIIPKK